MTRIKRRILMLLEQAESLAEDSEVYNDNNYLSKELIEIIDKLRKEDYVRTM